MNEKKLFYNYFGIITALFCLISMYIFPGITSQTVRYSVELCGKSVIPALFPYIVITRILLNFISKTSKAHPKLGTFRFSPQVILAYLSGIIAGIPAGAVLSGQMYSVGILTKKQAENTVIFSSVASPAFCINFFGGEIMNDRLYGVAVYIACIAVNILFYTIFSKKISAESDTEDFRLQDTDTSVSVGEIIYDSCITVITVCAYVTFFMCAGKVVFTALSLFINKIEIVAPFITGFSEMTSGIASLKHIEPPARFLSGSMIIGFGGLSAIMQVNSVCEKYGLCCKKLILIKSLCAATVPLTSIFIIRILYLFEHENTIRKYLFIITTAASVLSLTVFLIYFEYKRIKNIRKAK